jgi:hypothetical protein
MASSIRVRAARKHFVEKNIHTIFAVFFRHSQCRCTHIKHILHYALWTDENNIFLVESIKEAIMTKMHFQDN